MSDKPTRRQIVFNWVGGEDLDKTDGCWGTADQVDHVDELLVALDGQAQASIAAARARIVELESWNKGQDNLAAECGDAIDEITKLKNALAAARAQALEPKPWLYAIAEPNGHWQDGESCVFQDFESCQSDVDQYNENVEEGEPKYTVVPLYRRSPSDSTALAKLLAEERQKLWEECVDATCELCRTVGWPVNDEQGNLFHWHDGWESSKPCAAEHLFNIPSRQMASRVAELK